MDNNNYNEPGSSKSIKRSKTTFVETPTLSASPSLEDLATATTKEFNNTQALVSDFKKLQNTEEFDQVVRQLMSNESIRDKFIAEFSKIPQYKENGNKSLTDEKKGSGNPAAPLASSSKDVGEKVNGNKQGKTAAEDEKVQMKSNLKPKYISCTNKLMNPPSHNQLELNKSKQLVQKGHIIKKKVVVIPEKEVSKQTESQCTQTDSLELEKEFVTKLKNIGKFCLKELGVQGPNDLEKILNNCNSEGGDDKMNPQSSSSSS